MLDDRVRQVLARLEAEDDAERVAGLPPTAGSVSRASPSTSSAHSSSPASATFRRQVSTFAGSFSSETTRPPRIRAAAASQMAE